MITPISEVSASAPAFYRSYINRVGNGDLIPFLRNQKDEFTEFFWDIPADRLDFRYAEGKWSIREVFGHIIDTERIMGYRMLRFVRNDATELPGFDENDFVANANFGSLTDEQLLEDFNAVRLSTLSLVGTFGEEDWAKTGRANGQMISVAALGCVIAGHAAHHMEVIRERYF